MDANQVYLWGAIWVCCGQSKKTDMAPVFLALDMGGSATAFLFRRFFAFFPFGLSLFRRFGRGHCARHS